MLKIIVPGKELFNDATQEFERRGDVTLSLEHSLVSLSKWEQIFQKPFLGAGEKTDKETLAYIETMILDEDFPPEVFSRLTDENINAINDYISSSMTATTFREELPSRSQEVITSELIYFWMINFQIPFECQYWHINRLFALIKVCNVKTSKPKKRNPAEMIAERQRLNAERKAKYNTNG